jgi:xylan 1,4-beta-xylosidase
VRDAPDVGVLASRGPGQLTVLVWHYHDDDVPGPDAAVQLVASGLPSTAGRARLTHYRVDATHANVYATWQRLGSPASPSAEQYAVLEAASALATLEGAPPSVALDAGTARLEFALPRHGVSLLVLDDFDG